MRSLINFSFSFIAEKILSHIEKQRYDGYYNNLAHPDWGAVGKSRQCEEMLSWVFVKKLSWRWRTLGNIKHLFYYTLAISPQESCEFIVVFEAF